jgi:hypothetical protein
VDAPGRKEGSYLRDFDPKKPYGSYQSPEESLLGQEGAFYTGEGKFVRFYDEAEYRRLNPIPGVVQKDEPEALEIAHTARTKIGAGESIKIRKRFIKAFGQDEWDALPKREKAQRAKEILG